MWGLRSKTWAEWNKGPYYKRKQKTDSRIRLLLANILHGEQGNAGKMAK